MRTSASPASVVGRNCALAPLTPAPSTTTPSSIASSSTWSGTSGGPRPGAPIAAQRVSGVRDDPGGRLELLRSSYAPLPGAEAVHLRYRRAALAASVRFATHPSPLSWYLSHNVTIVSAYLEHRDLAEGRT